MQVISIVMSRTMMIERGWRSAKPPWNPVVTTHERVETTSGHEMDSAALSRSFCDALRRRDLDTMISMISMMAEDVCYDMANVPVLTSRDDIRDLYTSVFEAIGDAEIKLLDAIAQDNKAALILSLPGSNEAGGAIFHQWSDDGLLLRYQSLTRVAVPDSEDRPAATGGAPDLR